MSGKRESQKALQERHQVILSDLLREKSNALCADCDCKGPRWASWNLGVFLCIRCAGIHRNLGVHISRVKSVNLDSWTPEQISMMQIMGNSVAKTVYEANLPNNFPVPQTDSALEMLIRAKYEYKKYIAKDWSPQLPRVQSAVTEPVKKEKKHWNQYQPSRKSEVSTSQSRETSPGHEKKSSSKSRKPVELPGVSETAAQSNIAVQEFLVLDDSQRAGPVKGDDSSDLVLGTEILDLSNTESAASDQTRLANDAILALYGPSNDSIISVNPGSVNLPHAVSASYGGASLNQCGLDFIAYDGSVAAQLQTSEAFEGRRLVSATVTSSLSGSTWTQPSSIGSTLCASLWQ